MKHTPLTFNEPKIWGNRFEELFKKVQKTVKCPDCGEFFIPERRKPYVLLQCQNERCENYLMGENSERKELIHGVYARKSTEDVNKQVQSIPAQLKKLNEGIEQEALKVAVIIVEEGSAHHPGREGFGELMRILELRKIINAVLCWRASRLARNMIDGGSICHAVQTGDLRQIRTLKEVFDENTDMAYLSAQFGQSTQQSRTLSVDVKEGMVTSLEAGFYPGFPPIGYRKGTEEEKKKYGKSVKFPDANFPFAREALSLYDEGNHSLRSLTKHMQTRGMTTQFNRPINKTSMERILRNAFYFGEIHWKDKHTGEIKIYQGKHKPAIDKATYLRIQSRLDGRMRKMGRRHHYIYSKRVKCSCGRFLIPAQHKRHIYLECHNFGQCNMQFQEGEKLKRSVRQDILEQSVVSEMEFIGLNAKVFETMKAHILKERESEVQTEEDQAGELRKKIGEIEEQIKNLGRKLARDIISDEVYIELKEEFEMQKIKLEKEMSCTQNSHLADTLLEVTWMFNEIGKSVKDVFSTLPSELRQRCVELFFGGMEIRNSKLLIDYSPTAFELVNEEGEIRRVEPQKSQCQSEVLAHFESKCVSGARERT